MRLDEEACSGCGTCVEICPHSALKIGETSKPIFCDLCGGRPLCVERCPTGAPSFEEAEGLDEMDGEEELEGLWLEIDRLNEEILMRLAERVAISMRIGEIRGRIGRQIEDPEREAKVIERVGGLAVGHGIEGEG